MTTYTDNAVNTILDISQSRRRIALRSIASVLMLPVMACGQGERHARKEIALNVEMYSYLDRPIHDIIFNGSGLGVMNSYGGTGTITGVRVPYGIQKLKWTLGGPRGKARNGEHVQAKNEIVITPDQIPLGTRYIGLHLYPDDTVEVTFEEFIPGRTPRGEKILSYLK